MRYIKYFESLNLSSDLTFFLEGNKDKVSQVLKAMTESDFYSDDEDVNWITLAEDINKLSFRPLKRREGIPRSQYYDPKIMPTRIGRLVKKIINTAKSYFSHKGEYEIYVSKAPTKIYFSSQIPIVVSKEYESLGTQKIKLTLHTEIDSEGETKMEPEVYTFELNSFEWEFKFYHKEDVWFKSKKTADGYTSYITIPSGEKQPSPEKNYIADIEVISDLEIKDSDIENFVNKLIAYIQENRTDENQVPIEVKGEKIKEYYLVNNYKKEQGTLGNSCMRHRSCQDFLDIYCQNENQISLLVLLDDDDKVIARALLWTLNDGKKFLDRCYSIMEYDQIRFRNIAKKNGWYYYLSGNIYLDDKQVDLNLWTELDKTDFDSYPYVDSLFILDISLNTLSRRPLGFLEDTKVLNSTTGDWEDYYSDD